MQDLRSSSGWGEPAESHGMTVAFADPVTQLRTQPLTQPLAQPRRTGVDFIDEAGRAAAVARGKARAAIQLADAYEESAAADSCPAVQKFLRAAARLRRQAAAHERDAHCHEEAVLVMVSFVAELRR